MRADATLPCKALKDGNLQVALSMRTCLQRIDLTAASPSTRIYKAHAAVKPYQSNLTLFSPTIFSKQLQQSFSVIPSRRH